LRTLDKPTLVVLTVAVGAVVLNILLYCGLFVLWYRTPLIPDPAPPTVERNEVVRACGFEVLPEYRHLPEYRDLATDFARGMRKDCGIYGP
jgi:hypothetical protein